MKNLLRLLLFIFLTITTQIGGIAYLVSLIINKKWKAKFLAKKLVSFILIYALFTFLVVPFLAPLFGREKIKNTEWIKPTNYFTVILNRNYVKPSMNIVLANASEKLKVQNIEIQYLDANFPFIDKFPLLPHLSHSDGKKIDISLIYQTEKGQITNDKKSISGYGNFVNPKSNEHDQISICKKRGVWHYDFPKYLSFGSINDELKFSKQGTRNLIIALLKQPASNKIFIEPHLKSRLGIVNSKIRYQGCKAVRHDDHLHLEIK